MWPLLFGTFRFSKLDYTNSDAHLALPHLQWPNNFCDIEVSSYFGYDSEMGIMMSVQQYERLRGAAWERLTAIMDDLGKEALSRGLTEAGLGALLADES